LLLKQLGAEREIIRQKMDNGDATPFLSSSSFDRIPLTLEAKRYNKTA
jgi:hypothetical protein